MSRCERQWESMEGFSLQCVRTTWLPWLLKLQAEGIAAEELKRRNWDERALARRLRKETTMTLAWIPARLQMGSKTH